MAKYKSYDYSQSVLIPVCLDEQLVPGSLEFAIHTLVQSRMDTSVFDYRYNNDETGREAYDPKILLKVVLFGYSRGLISSRQIERACKENVVFMALSCGQQPDHSTIAAFISSMKGEILPLFRDVLLVCEEEGLLGGTFFALDGCRLRSNASKEWSGTLPELRKKKEYFEKKVKQLLEEQEQRDKRDDEDEGGGRPLGGGDKRRQIEKLQKKADRLDRWLKGHDAKIGKQGREIRSNVTDNESGLLVTSHGVIQGYNGQALVDSKRQVIVHAEAFGDRQDHHAIPPVLDGAKESMEAIGCGEEYFAGTIFTADSNYHDPTNLKKCDEEGLDAYIPDKRFRRRDPRFRAWSTNGFGRSKRFTLADFQRDEERDEYLCPNGKVFRLQVRKVVIDGIIYRQYVKDRDECQDCALAPRCIKGKRTTRKHLMVPVGSVPGNLSRAMAAKVDTEEGRRIYHQRLAIVEPVFANIETHKRLDRFTLRGKIKVNIQWMLYCMIHNIGKILHYGVRCASA